MYACIKSDWKVESMKAIVQRHPYARPASGLGLCVCA
jgi:hypothetical protein